jgi:hypothetical protein
VTPREGVLAPAAGGAERALRLPDRN